MREYRFYFHYNKPASKTAGYPKLSLHFRNKCHLADVIDCTVPCCSKNNKKQPHCVMEGFAQQIFILKRLDGKKEITIG